MMNLRKKKAKMFLLFLFLQNENKMDEELYTCLIMREKQTRVESSIDIYL